MSTAMGRYNTSNDPLPHKREEARKEANRKAELRKKEELGRCYTCKKMVMGDESYGERYVNNSTRKEFHCAACCKKIKQSCKPLEKARASEKNRVCIDCGSSKKLKSVIGSGSYGAWDENAYPAGSWGTEYSRAMWFECEDEEGCTCSINATKIQKQKSVVSKLREQSISSNTDLMEAEQQLAKLEKQK